ncbi:BadF/BadG/BcrA/BcrD ATPase family protein [Microbulbifer taiwanensis]|uniref:BadF/BadG/BcrA/BcrD ATPase family protein n=1 Tax=Microbulbifer taiwanensis TaxID=986746 RepID=A0ABW1YSV8_9GAMM|nr:BadF/BadG/BcrA/BcrD ATPase family protein [Microbulbifer taiwanensis]
MADDWYFLGIDAGGSRCRARLESADGSLLGRGFGGPANPCYGLDLAMRSIEKAAAAALADAGLAPELVSRLRVGAGVAGLHLPRYRDAMRAAPHPFAQLVLTDDLHIACLGAHGGGDGAVIIVGTGFSALSVVNGVAHTIGAHGFMMGETCSGAHIGFAAVNAALLAYDRLGEETLLAELLARELGGEGLMLANALAGATADRYAALAPVVFEAAKRGDVVAGRILREVAAFIDRVAQHLLERKPPRLSLVGGIGERIVPWLAPDIAVQLLPAAAPAEVGAIHLAREGTAPAPTSIPETGTA